jgi:hypothetical protein
MSVNADTQHVFGIMSRVHCLKHLRDRCATVESWRHGLLILFKRSYVFSVPAEGVVRVHIFVTCFETLREQVHMPLT